MEGKLDKRSFSRRDFLRLTGLAVGGTILSACAPADVETKVVKETEVVEVEVVTEVEKVVTATPPPMEEAEIWFAQRGGTDIHYLTLWNDELGPLFEERHPNIKVNYSPLAGTGPELLEKYLAMFVSGDAPDVFTCINEQHNVIMRKGQTLDLRPFIDLDLSDEDIADWNPKQLDHFRDENSWFGLPMYLGNRILIWNKDIFEAEGVEPPPTSWKDAWTHDEYTEVMGRLCKDEGGERIRWGASVCTRWPCLNDHLVPFGGNLVDQEDNTKCYMANPGTQEGLEWLRARFWDDGYMPVSSMTEGLVEYQAFIPQFTATFEGGPWHLRYLADNAQFKWDLAPLPKGPVTISTTATTDGYLGWSQTKYPSATWELLKFLSGPDWGKGLARTSLLQPARKSLMDYYITQARIQYPMLEEVNLELLKEANDLDLGHTYPVYRYHGEALEIIQPVLDQVFNLGEAPVSALADLCDEVEEVQLRMLNQEQG